MKEDKGVTLTALIITIVVMFLLLAISMGFGSESLEDTRLKSLYTHLDLVQKRIDSIAATDESYYDNETQIKLIEAGITYADLDSTRQEILNTIIENENPNLIRENFRYFTKEDLEIELELTDIEYNVFIDFENRIVISEQGVIKDGVEHHMLETSTYFVKEDKTKNTGKIILQYRISEFSTGKWKVKVIPNEIGNIKKNSTLKYKKTTTKYWETADNLEFIIDSLTKYDIKYTDNNNNKAEETIEIVKFEQPAETGGTNNIIKYNVIVQNSVNNL